MGKPKPKVEKDNAERWLLTYADLMNLLLIFFIILFAMSQVDQQKAEQLASSMRAAFGEAPGQSIFGNVQSKPAPIENKGEAESSVVLRKMEKEQMEEVKKQIEELANNKGLMNELGVSIEERGVRVSISSKLLFKSGSDEIEANSLALVKGIGEILLKIPGKNIRVEGHTDADPINTTRFPSNWELSSARADKVLRYLVEKAGLDPNLISSVGYGQYRPIAPNNSSENKAKNRRVDVVIIRSMYEKSEAGSDTKVNED